MESISIALDSLGCHLVCLGATGTGRSRFIEHRAAQLGVPYQEVEASWTPSAAQQQQQKDRMALIKQQSEQRLQAVRQAYWLATPAESAELYVLYDALSEHAEIDSPTSDQVRKLFFMLPAKIIGEGVKWSFSDTEVRDSICEFVRDHAQEVVAKLREGA